MCFCRNSPVCLSTVKVFRSNAPRRSLLSVCLCVHLGGAFGHNNLRVPGGRAERIMLFQRRKISRSAVSSAIMFLCANLSRGTRLCSDPPSVSDSRKRLFLPAHFLSVLYPKQEAREEEGREAGEGADTTDDFLELRPCCFIDPS